ncbi:hypothetical protein SEA_MULCHROOM_18 [Streptomyces phage Mulchroom]|nr:hypothetical protein SEA_MULCHROOM_18 [Streptomyces phage Mulchroom]
MNPEKVTLGKLGGMVRVSISLDGKTYKLKMSEETFNSLGDGKPAKELTLKEGDE